MGVVFPIADNIRDDAVTALLIKPIHIDIDYMNSLDGKSDMNILTLEQLGGTSGIDWEYLYVERLDENIYSLDDSISWSNVTGVSNAYVVCNQIGDIFWLQGYDSAWFTNGSFTIQFTDPLVVLSSKIFIGI